MKYLLILGTLVFASCQGSDSSAKISNKQNDSLVNAAMNDSSNYTTVEWIDSTNTDLGKIAEGSVVEVSWRFKNSGNKPLIIQDVTPGCGCTVAERPEGPVAPGAEDRIKARFDSKNQSKTFSKSITVVANTKGEQRHTLSFHGELK